MIEYEPTYCQECSELREKIRILEERIVHHQRHIKILQDEAKWKR